MNKLSKKFIWGITSILCLSCLCSILFNSKFLEAYYLYQKKNALASICDDFINSIGQQASIEEAVKRSEDSDKVIIVRVENDRNTSTDKVNDRIRNAFKEKGVGFQKYWLWEEDYRQIADGKRKVRLYKQDRLNYSLLIEYVQADSGLFAVTMFIPNIGDAFSIINTFLIIVNIAGIVISIILLILIVRRITKPLEEFKRFAGRMKDNEFVPLKVHTKDELEGVADSLNLMGSQIVSYQEALQEKNLQMEHFLDNVAHDLKTPVSLIRLYAAGIKDGLDDGSFLDTIEGESRRMGDMIESLLYVSGIGRKDVKYEEINLTRLLQSLIDG